MIFPTRNALSTMMLASIVTIGGSVGLPVTDVFSQSLPPKQAYPLDIKQLHVGHSLTDPLFYPWPGPFNALLADSNGLPGGYAAWGALTGPATLPGAWIRFHWDTTLAWCGTNHVPCYEPGMNPKTNIDQWQLMVITENMEGPLILNANQSREHLSYFVEHNWLYGNSGNGTPTLLWTNWGGLDGSAYFLSGHGVTPQPLTYSGWRQLLDSLEKGWHALQDYANDHRPVGCPPVYIIPGNRMMAQLYDDIQAGIVPGINSIADIFTDGVHLNSLGAYMVTMIHYACIFNKSPVGLSPTLGPVSVPPAFAQYVQQMVWELVTNYPRSGITNNPVTIRSGYVHTDYSSALIYPNPARDYITIITRSKNPSPLFYELIDVEGNKVKQGYLEESTGRLSLLWLSKGVYYLKYPKGIKPFLVH